MTTTSCATAPPARPARRRSPARRRARAAVAAALGALVVGTPGAARAADTLFANIGAFATYSPSGGSLVSGPGAAGFQVVSEGLIFTPTATGQLSLIELTLSRTGGTDPFRLTLYTAAPNGFPQTPLFTAVGPVPLATGSPIPLASFAVASGPVLTAGTSYVLVASSEGNGVGLWDSVLGGPGTIYRNEAGAERTLPAERAPGLRLSGALVAVPEPGTLALFPLGALALAGAAAGRHRRRRARG